MNQLFDLTRVSTATTGAGVITLGAVVPGFLTFAQAGVPNGAVVSYGIADGANSETGTGTYTAAGTTLTRTVYRSTGAGNNTPIALSGAAQVFITALSADFAGLQTPIAIASGGTGATTGAAGLANLGGAPLASPVFTGDPRAPTPLTADNDTSLATTAYVQAQGYATSAAMTTADNLRVLKAGDTMTGNLTIQPAGGDPALYLRKSAGTSALIISWLGATERWNMVLGDAAAESGGNVGSDFNLHRYSDAGAYIGAALSINRATGNATFSGNLTVGGGLFTGASGNTMQLAAGNALFNVNVVSNDNTKNCGFPGAAWENVSSYQYLTSSSAELKTGIEPVPAGALAQVLALTPQTYRWRDGPDTDRRHHGFIAEQVRAALGADFGGFIAGKESRFASVAYNELTAVLWRAVQELASEVAVLKAAAGTPDAV